MNVDVDTILLVGTIFTSIAGVVTGLLAYLGSARKTSLEELREIITSQAAHIDRVEKRVVQQDAVIEKQSLTITALTTRVRELEDENAELKRKIKHSTGD